MSSFSNFYEEVSVVVVGNFNPAIFNPDWLLRHELIRDEDIDDAEIDVIHPEVSRFSLAWCQVEVLANRFVLRSTERGYFEAARDLAVGMFSVLSETPITALGINSTFRDKSDNREIFDRLGDLLAPKEPWEKLFPKSPKHGLYQLNIQSERDDKVPGFWNTTIRPLFMEDGFGIEVQLNCHFAFNKIYENTPDVSICDIVLSYWDDSIELATSLHAGVQNLVKED